MTKNLTITIPLTPWVKKVTTAVSAHIEWVIGISLCLISVAMFILFLHNHLGLAYNDARSHLDIGRRVVEGLKPGLAQLGSVWLPLPHLLMVPTIWNDWMWHSGLAGALESMVSFVLTGLLVYLFLKKLGIGMVGRLVGVGMFIANWNVLYLQSTAMTELLLLGSMTAGVYYLLLWQEKENILYLVFAAFWILCATLNRYDGWFLLFFALPIVGIITLRRKGWQTMEGTLFFFVTLAGFGIVLWFLWNLLIFKDPLYFAFGPYSAHAQQLQLQAAGNLPTKGNIFLSTQMYLYALVYNMGMVPLILSAIGALLFFCDRKLSFGVKMVSTALFAPLVFNILALYFGFSVLFIQGLSGNTWFNVRYGIMMAPSVAVFIGYLIGRVRSFRPLIIGLLLLVTCVSIVSADAVTIDDARVGSSQTNVTAAATWLADHAANKPGFILIAAASHDAIIFSSGLPMSRFIHEGTGLYWISATTEPDRWARWIVMRTNDLSDQTFKLVHNTPGFKKYTLVGHFPFADIYELKPQYLSQLHTEPIVGKQK